MVRGSWSWSRQNTKRSTCARPITPTRPSEYMASRRFQTLPAQNEILRGRLDMDSTKDGGGSKL